MKDKKSLELLSKSKILRYCLKYLKSYFIGDIPTNETEIINEAIKIFKISHIQDVISASYSRVIVMDKYKKSEELKELIKVLTQRIKLYVITPELLEGKE